MLGIAGFFIAVAFSLLVYSIVKGPAFPSVPPEILALFGALISLRLAFWALLLAIPTILVCLIGKLVIMSAREYRLLSQEQKQEAWKYFWGGLNFCGEILRRVREFRRVVR